MLFSTEEKHLLTGAFVTGAVDTAFEAYFNYRDAGGYNIRQTPTDPLYYLYYQINPWVPPVDDLIALVGVPAIMYGVGRKKSGKLRLMGIGGLVYGLSEILGWTVLKVARFSAGQPVASQYRVVVKGVRQ